MIEDILKSLGFAQWKMPRAMLHNDTYGGIIYDGKMFTTYNRPFTPSEMSFLNFLKEISV